MLANFLVATSESHEAGFVKRISLFVRGLRENRDWSEISSVRVAPVVHVSPGPYDVRTHEMRYKSSRSRGYSVTGSGALYQIPPS